MHASNPSTNFSVFVLDHRGGMRSLSVHAFSAEDARLRAQSGGATVLHVVAPGDPGQASPAVPGWSTLRDPSPTIDTVTFSQDLATLLEAGVTVKAGLDTLARKQRSAGVTRTFHALTASVTAGLSLSAALARSKQFPSLLVATVIASERTGDLASGLARYARHQQSLRGLRDRVIGACVYPMLLLLVGSAVVAMLLGIVVPRFSRFLDMQGRELPWLSRLLMNWGDLANAHPWLPLGLLAVIGVVIAVASSLLRRADSRKRLLRAIPGTRTVVRDFQHLQMYRAAAILTARGITIQHALLHCLEFLDRKDALRLKAGLVRMGEGASLSTALSGSGLADPVAASMLGVAERSGALPLMLDRIADFHERALLGNIEIASRLIEPVLMIVFGILIGGLVLMMYLPIFDLASSIN